MARDFTERPSLWVRLGCDSIAREVFRFLSLALDRLAAFPLFGVVVKEGPIQLQGEEEKTINLVPAD